MTEMDSRAIADTRVYAQATEPTDTRDGIIWVDTSTAARDVFVYSTDTPGWEPVSPGIVSADPAAPSNPTQGDLWIDTDATPQRVNQWTGSQWTGLTNFGEFDTHRSNPNPHSNSASATDLTAHETDTANPHSVTANQVGSPTDAEFNSHTGDTGNPHSVSWAQTRPATQTRRTFTETYYVRDEEVHIGSTATEIRDRDLGNNTIVSYFDENGTYFNEYEMAYGGTISFGGGVGYIIKLVNGGSGSQMGCDIDFDVRYWEP